MQERRHDGGDGTGRRVLFVDDSRLMRFAANRFMRDEFEMVLAENGRQAWDALERDAGIGTVITDLNMPEVDGIELIHRIRNSSDDRMRAMPILVVTGVDEKSGRRRAMDAGANDLVPKPFTGSDLTDPVREYLKRAAGGRNDESVARTARQHNIEPTRDALVDRLAQLASFHDRHGMEMSLLHVRLDNYERIAGGYGLNWAESLMRHVERVLAREVRNEDTIGRSGDDTFSILLMATPAIGAKRLRDRLRRHLARNPARYPGKTLEAEVSFAIQCPNVGEGRSASRLLHEGLQRLAEPANVTRLADRLQA